MEVRERGRRGRGGPSELGDGEGEIAESAVDGQADRRPGEQVASEEPARRGLESERDEDGRDREALEERLELAGRPGPEGLAAAFEVTSQALDQQLPDDDRRHHPGCQARVGRNAQQVDESAADDHLVDQRVELAADGGPLIEQAGEVAVEGVGQGRDDEDREGRPIPGLGNASEDDDCQGQPTEREGVRDVPEILGQARPGRLVGEDGLFKAGVSCIPGCIRPVNLQVRNRDPQLRIVNGEPGFLRGFGRPRRLRGGAAASGLATRS